MNFKVVWQKVPDLKKNFVDYIPNKKGNSNPASKKNTINYQTGDHKPQIIKSFLAWKNTFDQQTPLEVYKNERASYIQHFYSQEKKSYQVLQDPV